ncbi:hypothetical protein EDI_174910 [Entamoeba dispar SAW760]|uniref:Uncharacterized protein n=1 Tax=Entamoeba dispar (strain ATCC PRA-260 / SAW760) TaxID=370354 RepID=B0EMM2_ENTDS|nr:uncharacterized protein EDI_174910 [Entamoeba dispar SAW760]EDR24212.1 hypothetical protein EDI_174910 [Entamoeba dispar SAW760]|eukprot:EDR24212.1 hypothetical protein EDI_174910 [Entamoeba dispar SAW760]
MNGITIRCVHDEIASPIAIGIETAPPTCDNSLMDCSQASTSTLLADFEVREIFKNKNFTTEIDEEKEQDLMYIGRSANPVINDETFFNSHF